MSSILPLAFSTSISELTFRNEIVLASLLMLTSTAVHAERYSVELDAFGNVNAEQVQVGEMSELDSDADETVTDDVVVKERVQERVKEKDKKAAKQTENPSDLSQAPSEENKISPFEKAYLESEKAQKEAVLKGLLNSPKIEEYDASKIDSLEFVDGDKLSKGEVEGKRPYYTVVDAEGNPRNIFYDTSKVEQALDQKNQNNIELTLANVFSFVPKEVLSGDKAKSKALSILLSGGKSFYERFAALCCEKIPNVDVPILELGSSQYFELSRDLLPFRLAEGDSRFALMVLPDKPGQDEFPIAVRTFIKEHKKESVDHGVFFPHLATLDENKKPIRIFTEPLLTYNPETWLKHGYLEGHFMIRDGLQNDERYLLVYTSKAALKYTSTVESGDEDDITIQHMEIGSVEVEVLAH